MKHSGADSKAHEDIMERREKTMRPVFAALLTGVLIYGLAMGTSYPLLGIALAGTVSDAWNGVSIAATGLGLMAGVGLMPAVMRRIGAGATAVLGVAIMAASLCALSSTQEFWLIFVYRLLLGVGSNLMFVVTETGLNVLSDPRQRGQLFGLYSMLSGVGFVAGPSLVAYAPGEANVLLLICSGVAVIAILPFFAVRKTLSAHITPSERARYLPSIRALPFAFVLLAIASAVDAVSIGLLPVIGMRSGFTAAEGAIFVTLFHLGLVCGQPAVGWLLDIWGRRRTILACILVSFAATGFLALGGAENYAISIGLMFCWGAANFGLYTAGLTLIGDRFSGIALSAATGSFALVYALAAIVAPALSGLSLDAFHASGFYALTGLIYFAAFGWALYKFRPLEPALAFGGRETET